MTPAAEDNVWWLPGEIRLDPRLHGPGRVPGQKTIGFNLAAFRQAIEERDIGYQSSLYAPSAEVRIVDSDNPPSAPITVRGRPAIRAWLLNASTRDLEPQSSTWWTAATGSLSPSDGTAATAPSWWPPARPRSRTG